MTKLPENFAKLPLAERLAILEELKWRYAELKAQEQRDTMTQTVIVSMN